MSSAGGGPRLSLSFGCRTVKRHTVEDIIDVPYFEIFDVPAPQIGSQLVEFMQRLDTVTPEQGIEVPEISGPNPTALC